MVTGKGKKRSQSRKTDDKESCCASADSAPEASSAECCASGTHPGGGSAQEMFKDFLGKAFAPGALDVVQKELLAVALAVAVQCDAC